MKIICIGRNYRAHCKELNNEIPEVPTFFMKPDTALLRNNEDFYIPSFSNDLHYEAELVVKIDRVTKSIEKEFAGRCYSEVGLGIDFTARDLQRECVKNGSPWEICKSFDKSAPVSMKFLSLEKMGKRVDELVFRLDINGETKQIGITKDMIFDIDEIISYVSKFVTLKIGDLIFTGTPSGIGAVKIGDHLEGYLEGEKLLDFTIK